jgi:hypothetical protein
MVAQKQQIACRVGIANFVVFKGRLSHESIIEGVIANRRRNARLRPL